MLGMLRTLRSLMSDKGLKKFNTTLSLNIISGILEGFSVLCLLPAISSLTSHQEPVYGLSFWWWILILSVLVIVTAVIEFLISHEGNLAAIDALSNLHIIIGDKLSRLPLGWFNKSRVGEMSELAAKGSMDIATIMSHLIGPLWKNTSSGIILVIGCYIWDWRLGLVLTLATPVFVLAIWAAKLLSKASEESVHTAEVEVNNRVLEFSRSQGALRSCGQATNYAPLEEALVYENRMAKRQFWAGMVAGGINGIIVQLISVALIVTAAVLAIKNLMDPVEIIAFMGVILWYSQVIERIGTSVMGVQTMGAQVIRAQSVMEADILPEPDVSRAETEPGRVEFDHVDFGYDDTPVLRDVSFLARPQQMIALVGPSGSGKTTIARLISRFYDVNSGTVRVGGVPVQDLTTEDLMSRLSMVFQDVYLFDDTLEANIRVGRDGASDEEVREAAEISGVSEIINRLPDGWSSQVGEGGSSLSGGERQRVSIARALLKKAPIVLFDEATSALDPENEEHIIQAINVLRSQSTVIVIAHKLTTVMNADQIVVLDDQGSVDQIGTHDELIDADGTYKRFWEERSRAVGWSLVRQH